MIVESKSLILTQTLGKMTLEFAKIPSYLLIFLELCVVDLSDLCEFGSVVRMFDGVVGRPS